jgi:hypothetical protein
MNLEPQITAAVDQLIAATEALEDRVRRAEGKDLHEALFAVREMLYDLRRVQAGLARVCESATASEAVRGLAETADRVLFDVIPHITGHLNELKVLTDAPPPPEVQAKVAPDPATPG